MTTKTATGRYLTVIAAAAAVSMAVLPLNPAKAQGPRCSDRKNIVSALNGKFKENLHGVGIVSNQRMVELYTSRNGSWTVLFTHPNGTSCIGAAGSNWQTMPGPHADGPSS